MMILLFVISHSLFPVIICDLRTQVVIELMIDLFIDRLLDRLCMID